MVAPYSSQYVLIRMISNPQGMWMLRGIFHIKISIIHTAENAVDFIPPLLP